VFQTLEVSGELAISDNSVGLSSLYAKEMCNYIRLDQPSVTYLRMRVSDRVNTTAMLRFETDHLQRLTHVNRKWRSDYILLVLFLSNDLENVIVIENSD